MITAVRTASVHDGKMAEALAWAVKVTNYVRDKVGANTQLMRNFGGPVAQIHWVSTFQSVSDFDKFRKQIEPDDGYKSLLMEAGRQGLFIATSIVDSLYESIA